jgi:predicted nucleic acid binding AN1-type Zn finger protein
MQNEIFVPITPIKEKQVEKPLEKLDTPKIQSLQQDVTNDPTLSASPPKIQKSPLIKVVRCVSCRTKVGMFGIACKCGNVYCSEHRMPESHECSYDFKGNGRKTLEQQNPKITAQKIEKI